MSKKRELKPSEQIRKIIESKGGIITSRQIAAILEWLDIYIERLKKTDK